MSNTNDAIKRVFSPEFMNDTKTLSDVGNYLYEGFMKNLLSERVQAKNYSYHTKKDIENENIVPPIILYCFVEMGANARNLENNKIITHDKIDEFRKKLDFGITVDNKFLPSIIVKNIRDLPQTGFPQTSLLDGGAIGTCKLSEFFDFGYNSEYSGKVLEYISKNTEELINDKQIKIIDSSYISQQPQLPPIPVQQQESEYSKPILTPAPTRDSSLLLYDLPSRQVMDYDAKTGQATVRGVPIEFAKEGEACFGTGYNDCEGLSTVLGDDNQELFNDLKNNKFDFNVAVIKNIQRMSPKNAMKLLDKFGFEIIESNGFKRYQTIGEWIVSLPRKGVEPNAIDNIKRNILAQNYLSALVDYINGAPKILNPARQQPQESSSQYLRSLGIKPLPPIKLIETQRRTGDTLLQMANVLKQKHILSTRPMLYPQFAVHVLHGQQLGGGEKSNKLRLIINGLIKDLESRGKKLSDRDRVALMSNLDMLEQLEDNLEKLAQKLTQYRGWTDTIPDRTPEVVSVGSAEDKITKYKDCVRQQQKLEIGLLEAANRLDECLKS